jgi:hypothetical protein
MKNGNQMAAVTVIREAIGPRLLIQGIIGDKVVGDAITGMVKNGFQAGGEGNPSPTIELVKKLRLRKSLHKPAETAGFYLPILPGMNLQLLNGNCHTLAKGINPGGYSLTLFNI